MSSSVLLRKSFRMSSEPTEEVIRYLRGRTVSVDTKITQKKPSKSKPNPFSALKETEEENTSENQNLPSVVNIETDENIAHSSNQESNSQARISPVILTFSEFNSNLAPDQRVNLDTSVEEEDQENSNTEAIKIKPEPVSNNNSETESEDDVANDNSEPLENNDNLNVHNQGVIQIQAEIQPEIQPEIHNNPEENMAAAISITDLVEVIPKVSDEKSLEHFIAIVDNLTTQVPEEQLPMFLIVVKSRIIGKAFQAIKGKTLADWNEIKATLQAHLDVKIDYSTALNRLTRIKQDRDETLRSFIEKIRDALAVLNKVTVKDIPLASQAQVILINDATARNTFEAGLGNHSLKTVTIAAQKTSFVDSYSFATNQEQTNFPTKERKEEAKSKPEPKTMVCFKCNQVGHRAINCFKSNSPPRRNNTSPDFVRNNSYNGPNLYRNYDNNRPNNSQNFNRSPRDNNNNYQRNAPVNQNYNRNNQNGFSSNPNNGWNSYNNPNRQNRPNVDQRNQNAIGPAEHRNSNIRTIRETEENWDEISPLEVNEAGN